MRGEPPTHRKGHQIGNAVPMNRERSDIDCNWVDVRVLQHVGVCLAGEWVKGQAPDYTRLRRLSEHRKTQLLGKTRAITPPR